ncbi:HupE/UreJ protein [Rhodoferax ferrireducens T118]|uniref:HupE/UreJ protein n=1 Tax=Albidiferax ferrireducens (strain ATCC BAA-621 / DSM 15236 / T118) TaxID=338969 RepID=Q21R18_ALBFT|nr:HupE/UreJ family protein [Rhodoferax ferrireducens]ABD71785.1 HupE/UreJ protein [Rhodoferax ferrireducens T118]
MKFLSHRLLRNVSVGSLALVAGLAQAHTGHGTTGVFEGLVHPFGLDHLLAMVAVGMWSVSALPASRVWWGPATFLLALVIGAALGAMGLTMSWLEQLISLSVVLFGVMLVASRQKMPLALGLGLIALASSMHGLAHGAETPDTGFAGYAAGFLLTTATLHLGGAAAGLGVRRYLASTADWVITAMGTLLGGAGLYLFSQL